MSSDEPITPAADPQPPLPADLRARAAEVRALFEQHAYGRFPAAAPVQVVKHQVDQRDAYTLHQFDVAAGQCGFAVAVFVPTRMTTRAVLLGPNFYSNHTVHPDPAIRIADRWIPEFIPAVVDHRGGDATRGRSLQRWEIDRAMSRGVAVATYYVGDLWPDHDDGSRDEVARAFADRSAPDATGALAAWAWGLHRAADAIAAALPPLAGVPTFVWGHSRHGKAALIAAAFDDAKRFAGVISNQSGCAGAALYRGKQGERVRDIAERFPYWFAPRFRQYADREAELPFDQHWLLGLAAPRPLLVCSAEEDHWADPPAERRAALAARPAWPAAGGRAEDVEYHVRPGGHSVIAEDWETYLSFVERHI